MKHRPNKPSETEITQDMNELCETFSQLKSAKDVEAFLLDLCTPAELEAMRERWKVVPLINQGMSYREIHDVTGVSITTIGRVARALELGMGGYQTALSLKSNQPSLDTADDTHHHSKNHRH